MCVMEASVRCGGEGSDRREDSRVYDKLGSAAGLKLANKAAEAVDLRYCVFGRGPQFQG